VLLRRVAVAGTAAGTGFLLLAALAHAASHPGRTGGSVLRLVWCAVPFALTAYLAVRVARTEPSCRLYAGARHGQPLALGRVRALGAASTALSCAVGIAVALTAFQRPVPLAGALTLLVMVPVVAAAAAAVSLRPPRASKAPGGLPWGAALVAIGVAVEFSAGTVRTAGSAGSGPGVALPGGLGHAALPVLFGWALTAAGLVLAGPGLVHICGRLLGACQPGALRLLAGRALQEDAPRVGRPLGVLCAVASALYAAGAVARVRPAGPLTAFGITLVLLAALAAALTAMVEAREARLPATAALTGLGAPASLLRGAAALRTGAVLAAAVPVTWAVAELAALPLGA
jgi:hypothetical protein